MSPSGPRMPRSSSTSAGVSGVWLCAPPTPTPPREGEGMSRSGSLRGDLPGVAGREELDDVAGAAFGDRALLLGQQHVFVDRPLDRTEHTDRHREVRYPEIGQELRGVDVVLVVDPHRALG